jgi:hypothetical protein
MSFGDDDICQSLEFHFGEAGSFGACDQCNSRNHAIAVGCSGMDDFGRHDFGLPAFGRHYIEFGGQHQSVTIYTTKTARVSYQMKYMFNVVHLFSCCWHFI